MALENGYEKAREKLDRIEKNIRFERVAKIIYEDDEDIK